MPFPKKVWAEPPIRFLINVGGTDGCGEINIRIAGGAKVKPGKLTFDKKLKMATLSKKAAANSPAVAAKKGKAPAKRERN